MILSPFNSIFFIQRRKSNGIECPYTQTFSCADSIMVQAIRTYGEESAPAKLVNAVTGRDVKNLSKQTYSIGNGEYVDCHYLSDTPEGFYFIAIGEYESETFRVTENEELLKDTVVIEYSTADNRSRRDVVGNAGGSRLYFLFRIPGGFKDNGWNFSIDSEHFVTQMSDMVELYARESTQYTLTIGQSQGVPIWFGDLLNRLLTCKYVYIDGQRYSRYESSVPEKEQTLDGTNSFVFSQKLQRINHLEPQKQ